MENSKINSRHFVDLKSDKLSEKVNYYYFTLNHFLENANSVFENQANIFFLGDFIMNIRRFWGWSLVTVLV